MNLSLLLVYLIFQVHFNMLSEINFVFWSQGLSATPSRPSNVAVEGGVEVPLSEVWLTV